MKTIVGSLLMSMTLMLAFEGTGRAQLGTGTYPGNQIAVFWLPSTSNALMLASTTNKTSGNWQNILNAKVVAGLVMSNTAPAMYFQLFQGPLGMAIIPEGTFMMGDTLDGETDAVPTQVYVSTFYVDTNLVSIQLWEQVHTWATNNGYQFDADDTGGFRGPGGIYVNLTNDAVNDVNWYDSVKWCNARSLLAGLTPAYYTDSSLTQFYTKGESNAVYVHWGGQRVSPADGG